MPLDPPHGVSPDGLTLTPDRAGSPRWAYTRRQARCPRTTMLGMILGSGRVSGGRVATAEHMLADLRTRRSARMHLWR